MKKILTNYACTNYACCKCKCKQAFDLRIKCDANQIIQHVESAHKLNYETKDLVGNHINILIPENVRSIHDKHLERIHNTQDQNYCDKIIIKLKNLQNMVNVLKKDNECVLCYMMIKLKKNLESTLTLSLCKDTSCKASPQVPDDFKRYVNSFPAFHIKEYTHTICVLFDLCNSCMFGVNTNNICIAKMYYEMIKIVHQILYDEYYPYVFIHETVGDSILLLANMQGITPLNDKIFNLVVCMSVRIVQHINAYINTVDMSSHGGLLYLRCGISCGNIVGGVVDGKTFRIFGNCVNKSSRLQALCTNDSIIIDDSIYNKLDPCLMSCFSKQDADIKGFGLVDVWSYKCICGAQRDSSVKKNGDCNRSNTL